MPGAADFVTAVLALPNLDCLWECQDASGNPVDSSPNGFDATSVSGTVGYQVAGPDAGTDFGISLNPGVVQRSSPMNTNTVDWAVGMWVRWINNSVNQALVENGSPGANGYGALLVGSAALRGIAHGIGFKGTSAADLSNGLWQFVGMQCTAGGNWEFYFGGQPDINNPIGSGAIAAPTTKFIVARDGAQFEVAYVFSVSQALSAPTWSALYAAMVGGPPTNVTPPALSGAAVADEVLTTDDGTWNDADSFTYQWEDSPDGVGSWAAITGETSNTYVVDPGEIGNWLRCVVTAQNGDGDTDEPSNVLGPVLDHLTGTVVVAADDGTQVNSFAAANWTPDTSAVLAGDYMIAAIEAAFTGASGITTTAGWELLHTASGGGSSLVNVYGKFSYEDAPTEVFTFASNAQTACVLTVVRGGFNASDPIDDMQVTTDNSLGTVTYNDQDLVLGITLGNNPIAASDISAIPAGFTDVRKERSPTLVVTGWVVDSTKLEATGSGTTAGLSFTYSSGSDVYTLAILIPYNPGDVPEIVTSPVASGDVIVLGAVSTTDGTWTFTPTSFTYQWQDSADGITGWANLPGETGNSLTIDIAENGQFLRCEVTAHNGAGASLAAPSNVLGPVLPYPTVRYFTAIS